MAISDSPKSVTATLNYFSPPSDGSRPFQHINADPATGQRKRNWAPEARQVEITNLRGKEHTVSLDTFGFEYLQAATVVEDFNDEGVIRAEYYPETEKLLKETTGASRVVLFDHTIRRNDPSVTEDTPEKRHPATQVHVDQTTESSQVRVRRHLSAEEAEAFLASGQRFQIINFWRPITNPAFDFPLALCDYRSVDARNDLVPTALIYPTHEGETNSVKFSNDHKWYYLRGMKQEEAVLIKCFDSVQDGSVAVFTPHTAFVDPSTPVDAPFRQSIEMRALVFYD